MERNNVDTKKQDQFEKMTATPIWKLIITLSIPTVISMMVTNIYNLVDTAFVGTLGNSASGAVGIVFGFMAILQAVGFLFGQGSGCIVARHLGNKDSDSADRVASTGVVSVFAIGLMIAIICMILLDPLVMMLGSTVTIAPFAKTYIFYILLAAPFTVTSFTLNNILRYEGRAALGMVGLMVGAGLNILGDFILMMVLKIGIAGAGISTAVSQIFSFSILLSMFFRGKTTCRLSLKKCRFTFDIEGDILSTGFPSLIRQALNSITTIMLNSQAAFYGSDQAVAAMSIVSRIVFFTFSIALGIGQGFQPVSGFNYGAKRYDRVKKGYWFTIALAEALLVVFATVVFILSNRLIGLFRDDVTVIEIGTRALRLQCLAQIVMPFCMTTEMMLQSTRRKLEASVLSAVRGGLVFIPVLLILAKLRGISGIQEAQPVAFVVSAIPAVFMAIKFWKEIKKEQEQVELEK